MCRNVSNPYPIIATGFCKSQHAMIKRITPPSAFQVHSAVSDVSLVTHGTSMKNTLGQIGIIVTKLGYCDGKWPSAPIGLIKNRINKLKG